MFHRDDGGAASPSSQAMVLTTSAVAKTPGRPRRRSELPPSPADVADDVEYATTKLYSGIDDLITVSGIPETIENVRELCSSVTSVQMTFLFLEAAGLQRYLLPWKATGFAIPSYHLLGINTPPVPVMLPDLFSLLTAKFWATSLLWASTSVFVPLVFAYFYNLSTRDVKRHGARVTVARYSADPMTFSVVKALITWMVYSQGYMFGFIDDAVASHVHLAMFGGYQEIMIGSYVGAIAALYEAAQRK